MTHIPIQLPFKGFTEQSQFSAVPPGMTPSCVNMMPSDVWNGRTRISTRNGTQLFNTGGVQFMSTFRVFEAGAFVEKLIFVRGGVVFFCDPRSSLPATPVAFGDGTTQTTPFLNTTGLVEGVQFNEHYYFVDGDHYVLVHLATPASAAAVTVWGNDSPKHGPFHTDPGTITSGCRATLICRWGSRLVLAGYKNTPNIWFACSPDDTWPVAGGSGGSLVDGWSGGNPIGAITGTTANEYGTLGDPIVAIFPFAQSGLMFACTNSFSFLTADPILSFDSEVQMVSLTRSIGISGRRAFCQSQEKGAFILANDGLYYLNANDFNFNRANRVSAGRLDSFFLRLDFGTPAIGGSGPLSGGTLRSVVGSTATGSGATVKVIIPSGTVTEEPDATPIDIAGSVVSLVGELDTGEVFPCLCYDPDREGVWIFLTVSGVEQSSLHLYYDLKTDSFWPQRFADPDMFGPTSACYVGTSRTNAGRLFLGGSESIAIIDRAFPIGIDGVFAGIGEDEELQRAQFVRSSLTLGPIIAPLPYRIQINEVRVDLANDQYEVPADWVDASDFPILSIGTGDTAQAAIGLQSDSLFVTNINELVIDCGNASATAPSPIYDGGAHNAVHSNTIDGRFAIRPFGQYTQADPFAAGTTRVYNGPGNWVIEFDGSRWILEDNVTGVDEYQQITPDGGSPDGMMENMIQNPISPNVEDNARVTGASFPNAEITEIGQIRPGRNEALKCRIRAECAYITIASDGRPWSIERMSVVAGQVGKSRGGVT